MMFRSKTFALLLGAAPILCLAENLNIEIRGVNETLETNIREGLSLAQKSKTLELDSDQIELLHQRSVEEILYALQPYGYYHAKVQAQLYLNQEPIRALYKVTLNAPTTVDELSIQLHGEGQHNHELEPLTHSFSLKKGDVFIHSEYEKSKTELLQAAIEQGYLKAYFVKHQVVVDLSHYQADIALSLDTGKRFYFGALQFDTQYYDESFLRRFSGLTDTSPYRLEDVVNFENRLLQSSLFSSVQASPKIDESNQTVPLKVSLVEAPPNRYLFGIGYDTNTKSRVRFGWDRRKINRWGHQFKSQLKFSEKDTAVDAAYIIPGKRPWLDQYKLSIGYANDEFKDKPSELYTAEISETREWYTWRRTFALRYLNETFTDSDFIKERSTFVLPSVRMVKSSRDDLIEPTDGYKIELSARGGLDALLSDHNFVQVDAHLKWLKQISTNGTVIARTELGATFPNDIDELPLSIRFYAGGNESLRGFRFRSLPSEIDHEGRLVPVGGTYIMIGSLEYAHTVWGPIQVAAFTDAGGAFRDFREDWQASVGVGLRWKTPIGPFKLDVAKPLSQGAEVLRLHMSFGPEI